MRDLSPCPHCGGRVRLVNRQTEYEECRNIYVTCDQCHAWFGNVNAWGGAKAHHKAAESMARRWNRYAREVGE